MRQPMFEGGFMENDKSLEEQNAELKKLLSETQLMYDRLKQGQRQALKIKKGITLIGVSFALILLVYAFYLLIMSGTAPWYLMLLFLLVILFSILGIVASIIGNY